MARFITCWPGAGDGKVLGSCRHNGKEIGNYRKYRDHVRDNLGTMENKMETTIMDYMLRLYWGYYIQQPFCVRPKTFQNPGRTTPDKGSLGTLKLLIRPHY